MGGRWHNVHLRHEDGKVGRWASGRMLLLYESLFEVQEGDDG